MNLINEAFFFTVSSVAIAITGFVGVIAALRNRRDDEWPLNELNGVKLVIEHTLSAVFLGLCPSIVSMRTGDAHTVWVSSSSCLAIALAIHLFLQAARVKKALAHGAPPRSMRLLAFTWFAPTVFVLLAQLANIASWRNQAVFASGLLWVLAAACIQFMHSFSKVKVASGA